MPDAGAALQASTDYEDRPADRGQLSESVKAEPEQSLVQPDSAAIRKAEALFDEVTQAELARSPEFQTYLGIKDDYGKWDELTEEAAQRALSETRVFFARARALENEELDEATRLNLTLLLRKLENEIEAYRWRYHYYPLNQMFGYHEKVPSFLINQHQVNTVADAEAYVSRLNGVPALFEQLRVWIDEQADRGIIPPDFVFSKVIQSSHNVIEGHPFPHQGGKAGDSDLLTDFRTKVMALNTTDIKKAELLEQATAALLDAVLPAYAHLIHDLEKLEKLADQRHGVWRLPEGDDYYAFLLRRTTTTELSAKEIQDLGLNEVERIHDEMQQIMEAVGFDGSLQDFFEFMKNDPQFYLPQTEEGRQAYLDQTQEVVDRFKARMSELFRMTPEADLIIKPVEPFREKTAGMAFYTQGTADGSRPGTYYVNLHDMKEMPTYELEALAYHEALPGHHMQISIALEQEDMPEFRKHSDYTAYIEGWGLYAESVPKLLGFYSDPYSDFGRLSMELWRACRLVVDTGIHSLKWTREEAIDYLLENTPSNQDSAERAIERYIVMPSQATAYKIGMEKLIALRERAKDELGDDFDIRDYHDLVLGSGALPLDILEERVNEWIRASIESTANL